MRSCSPTRPSLPESRLAAAVMAAVLSTVLASAPAPLEAQDIQVKGSDTIGGELGPDLARAFMSQNPEVRIDWESLGSGTAFVGLLDGSADLGASSRPIKEKELGHAVELGVNLQEYVLGYDGIAVIVHESNPVESLTIGQLSDVFTGKIRNWSELGAPAARIRLISRPSYSGTHGFFKDKVVRKGKKEGTEEFAPSTEFVEETADIVDLVAVGPRTISYVGLGYVTDQPVKVVGVALAEGQPAIKASLETVRDGSYPIYRPLLLYTRGEPTGRLRDFLLFIGSDAGQELVAANDFIPTDTGIILGSPADPAPAQEVRPSEIARIFFSYGGTTLTPEAKATLQEVAQENRAKNGRRLLLVGHADSKGPAAANAATARRRAEAAADYLTSLGYPEDHLLVESRAADEPIATNNDAKGRGQNRRVDIQLIAGG